MNTEQQPDAQAPEPKDPHAAPGAPTAPAEHHREVRPEPVECVECRVQIPADEAVAAEALEYILYFCSPECHEAWEGEQAQRSDAARGQEQEQHGKG